MAQTDQGNTQSNKWTNFSFIGALDQSTYPGRGAQTLQQATNVVYRRINAVGKRTGTGPWGSAPTGGAQPFAGGVRSGYRWYRGIYATNAAPLRAQVVQAGDAFYVGNDVTGIFTAIPLANGVAVAAGSTPAFYASMYDTSEKGGTDCLFIAYGSGQVLVWNGTDPMRYAGAFPNPFAGVYFWHEHLWFWGDPAFPDSVFVSDLARAELSTFVSGFGPYQIGRGDGDSLVTGMIDTNNSLIVTKNSTTYVITGFDFVQGEYPFSVQPAIAGVGTSNGHSLGRLPSGDIIFWTGATFRRLPLGASATIPLGLPIAATTALAAGGNQSVIRACAGSFLVSDGGGLATYNDLYLCAMDDGTGVAANVFVYDDYASARAGDGIPRWSIWTGVPVGAFIPWVRNGEPRFLHIGHATAPTVLRLGQNAASDSGQPIVCTVQTAKLDAGSPDRMKDLLRTFLEVEANQTTFYLAVEVNAPNEEPTMTQTEIAQAVDALIAGGAPPGTPFGATTAVTKPIGPTVGVNFTLGSTRATASQSVAGYFKGIVIRGRSFSYTITEASTTSLWELLGFTYATKELTYETS